MLRCTTYGHFTLFQTHFSASLCNFSTQAGAPRVRILTAPPPVKKIPPSVLCIARYGPPSRSTSEIRPAHGRFRDPWQLRLWDLGAARLGPQAGKKEMR